MYMALKCTFLIIFSLFPKPDYKDQNTSPPPPPSHSTPPPPRPMPLLTPHPPQMCGERKKAEGWVSGGRGRFFDVGECDLGAETLPFLGRRRRHWETRGGAPSRRRPGAGLPAVPPRPAATQEKPASSPCIC